MQLNEIVNFYVLTQGEIDKLWEFFLLSHLAIIGWIVTADSKIILKARFISAVTYIILFSGLYIFFYESYNDMILIQKDIGHIVNSNRLIVSDNGYVNHLLSYDIEKRLLRVTIFFISAAVGMMTVMFRPINYLRNKSAVQDIQQESVLS
jgi:hypothetical protein